VIESPVVGQGSDPLDMELKYTNNKKSSLMDAPRKGGPKTICREARAKAPTFPAPCPHLQSQRDCVTQPRVARNELPWVKGPMIRNPNGVVARFYSRGHRPQPFQGCLRCRVRFPRVARSSQPWALLRNPFGIQRLVQRTQKRITPSLHHSLSRSLQHSLSRLPP